MMKMKITRMTLPTPATCLAALLLSPAVAGAGPLVFREMCDASAAVQLNGDLFAAANDEDNLLRFYRLSQPGRPLGSFNLNPFLFGSKRGGETDLEAAARVGDRVYWITSHGRNKAGESDPNRRKFFALDIERHGRDATLKPVGRVYTELLTDLLHEPSLARFDLATAAERAPKAEGGLNIEALTDAPDGSLLIGFRNPIPQGRALVVPLLNPALVITGARPQFGEPALLDLGGLGLRGMGSVAGGYYLIAGPADQEGSSQMFWWPGGNTQPQRCDGMSLQGFNPEAICFHDDTNRTDYVILSDDGTRKVDGKDCKKLPKRERQFRAYEVARARPGSHGQTTDSAASGR